MCPPPPRLSLTEIPTTLVIILTYRLGMGMQKKCCQYLPCHKRKAKSLDREDVVGIKKRTRLCTCRKSNEIFTTFFYTNYLQTWLYDSFCKALYKSLRMDIVWALSSALNIHRRWKLSSLKMETFYHLLYTLDELKYFKSTLCSPCLC